MKAASKQDCEGICGKVLGFATAAGVDRAPAAATPGRFMLTCPLDTASGCRTVHFPHYLAHGARGLDWVEIISENFFGRAAAFGRAREGAPRGPRGVHGVSLGIASADPL